MKNSLCFIPRFAKDALNSRFDAIIVRVFIGVLSIFGFCDWATIRFRFPPLNIPSSARDTTVIRADMNRAERFAGIGLETDNPDWISAFIVAQSVVSGGKHGVRSFRPCAVPRRRRRSNRD